MDYHRIEEKLIENSSLHCSCASPVRASTRRVGKRYNPYGNRNQTPRETRWTGDRCRRCNAANGVNCFRCFMKQNVHMYCARRYGSSVWPLVCPADVRARFERCSEFQEKRSLCTFRFSRAERETDLGTSCSDCWCTRTAALPSANGHAVHDGVTVTQGGATLLGSTSLGVSQRNFLDTQTPLQFRHPCGFRTDSNHISLANCGGRSKCIRK